MALDDEGVGAGGCTEVEDEEGAFAILLSPPPSAPPPPPLRVSLKSWDSMVGLSVAEVVGVCRLLFALLPLGIPTKWLWLEWLVKRSFISS